MKINNQEYLVIVGVKALAQMYESKLRDIQNIVADIIKESPEERAHGGGWSGELIYTDISVEDFIIRAKLEIEDE